MSNSGGSLFESDPQNEYPTYQEPSNGPWGTTIKGQMNRMAELNVPFDQQQFEEAKQNGCLPPPCKAYPSWPPPFGTGFIYPSLEKGTQETLLGEERGCFPMASPFIDAQPILPSVNMPADDFGGQLYSPSKILNMYDCLNTPQPLSNKCFGYMPYDATYMASARAQGGQAKGWLDDPLSPVPITSVEQPVAVQTDIPSQIPSDRNENYPVNAKGNFVPDTTIERFASGVRPIVPKEAALRHSLTGGGGSGGSGDYSSRSNTNSELVLVEIDVDEVDNDDRTQPDKCTAWSWSCMVRAVRGFLQDLIHPERQPDDEDTMDWLFRNHRPYYLALFMALVIVSCFLIHSVCGKDSKHVVQLFCIFVVAFLVYLALPRKKGKARAQTITALFVLSVVVWGLVYKAKI